MSFVPTSPPPFPGGKKADLAGLDTLDFSRLAAKEPSEVSKLLAACTTHGFFYLDLQTTERVLDDETGVLQVMADYFKQPVETKMKDDRGSVTHGYKPVGTFSGVAKNSRDCYETLKVARPEMVAKSDQLPSVVKKNEKLFDSFISSSHYITHTIMSCLSDALHLDGSSRLEMSHRDGEPTNTTLVLLHYPKNNDQNNVGHNKHTDIGSLTLLFSDQWGLQVVDPVTNGWTFVQPRPGYAVINVGDSLRFLSGKRLNSCLHRVIPVNGGCQEEDRYSIAYFLRPESGVNFKDVEGKKVTAEKWHDDKYVMFAEPHAKQEQSEMLTGGMEQILVN